MFILLISKIRSVKRFQESLMHNQSKLNYLYISFGEKNR